MSEPLPCVEIEPESSAESAIIWMHGLGASGHDFEAIVPMLGLPNTRFVFPHAPARPVTINQGWLMPAWYDITSLEHREGREHEADIRESEQHITTLIERERDRGITPDRVVVAGFSQGAAMALHTGCRYPQPLAGVLVLSGYLVLESAFEREANEANRATPMLFCHGEADGVVAVALGSQAHARIAAWSSGTVDWHTFPIGHEVNEPELMLIRTWLHERVG